MERPKRVTGNEPGTRRPAGDFANCNGVLETEKILNDTLNKSLEILDFDVGYIRTLDAEKKNLIVRVARGLSSPNS